MREETSTSSRIRAYVMQKFPAARKRKIDDDVALLESGVIDSLGVLDLVQFLDESFGITISDDELTPDNFSSINAMAAFVEQKRAQNQVAAK